MSHNLGFPATPKPRAPRLNAPSEIHSPECNFAASSDAKIHPIFVSYVPISLARKLGSSDLAESACRRKNFCALMTNLPA
jgi:hypothetical protein